MTTSQLLHDWERDQWLIDRTLDRCFQALQRRNATLAAKRQNNLKVWDSAHSDTDSPLADPFKEPKGSRAIAAPETCTPLTQAALEWLRTNEPLLNEAAAAAEVKQTLSAWRALEMVCEKYSLDCSDLAKRSDDLGLDVRGIEHDSQRIHKMLDELYNHNGWTVSHESEVKVFYRHLKGEPYHSVKLEAVLEAPIEHVLALAVEYDLTKMWNSFMKASDILHAEYPFLSYIYGSLWTPVVTFDACVKAEGFDLGEEERCLLVGFTNMTEEEIARMGNLPAGHERRRRAVIGTGSCFRVEALPPTADGRSRTRGMVMGHLNPRLPFVPAFLVNFVLKVASPVIFKMMKKAVAELFRDPDGLFCQRMREKPEVYAATQMRTEVLMKKFYGVEDYAPAMKRSLPAGKSGNAKLE